MDATNHLSTDPATLIEQLDAGVIRERIDAIDRERSALLVLLRAAQRAKRNPPTERQKTAATG